MHQKSSPKIHLQYDSHIVSVKLFKGSAKRTKESMQAIQAPNLKELVKTFWIRQGSAFLSENIDASLMIFQIFQCLVILKKIVLATCHFKVIIGTVAVLGQSQDQVFAVLHRQLWPKQSVDPARIRGSLALLLQGQKPSRVTPDITGC